MEYFLKVKCIHTTIQSSLVKTFPIHLKHIIHFSNLKCKRKWLKPSFPLHSKNSKNTTRPHRKHPQIFIYISTQKKNTQKGSIKTPHIHTASQASQQFKTKPEKAVAEKTRSLPSFGGFVNSTTERTAIVIIIMRI